MMRSRSSIRSRCPICAAGRCPDRRNGRRARAFERFAHPRRRLPNAALDAYDTQIAAFCGYGMSISLLDLVRDVAGVTLLKSQTVSDWSTRPFTPRQVEYLVDDVRYLFAVADRLNEKLVTRGRLSWALEEMRTLVDPRTYRSDKRRLYLRVAGTPA